MCPRGVYHALFFLLALSLALGACNRKLQPPVEAKDFKVVGYLHANNFGRIDRVPLQALTHLDLAFANPDRDGNLVFPGEQGLSRVVDQAHQAGVQVYLSIAGGGIDADLAAYWLVALQPENRPAFVRQLVELDPANAYRDEVGAIFYNGIPTMVKKTELAMKSFGGIMIWEITQDSGDDLSLLQAIDRTLRSR